MALKQATAAEVEEVLSDISENSVERYIDLKTKQKNKRGRPKGRVKLKQKMTELVAIRWDATKSDEASIRSRYREDLTVEDALAELAKLRDLCQIAAREVNQRLSPRAQNCASCGNPMDPNRHPVMTEPMFDVNTGTYYNNVYCSIICVQKRNLKKMGREDLVK